jgi:hypothetical protein
MFADISSFCFLDVYNGRKWVKVEAQRHWIPTVVAPMLPFGGRWAVVAEGSRVVLK